MYEKFSFNWERAMRNEHKSMQKKTFIIMDIQAEMLRRCERDIEGRLDRWRTQAARTTEHTR